MKAYAVVLLVLAIAIPAVADLNPCVLEVQACDPSGICVGVCVLTQDDGNGHWDGGVYYWHLTQDHEITSFQGDVVATLYAYAPEGSGETSLEYHGDPEVHLNFAVTAGNTATTFQLTSTHLTFDPLLNPVGKAEVGINVSDRNGNGATLNSVNPNLGMQQAYLNGLAPAGNQFADILAGPIAAPAFGSGSASANSDYQPIAGTVSSMSEQVNFQLTARDLASGSATFVITPEPAGLALLGLVVVLRRR